MIRMKVIYVPFVCFLVAGCATHESTVKPAASSKAPVEHKTTGDLSTPQAAKSAYDNAVEAGDTAAAKAVALYDANWEKYIDGEIAAARGMKRMREAAETRWGDSSKRLFGGMDMEGLPGAEYKVSGDTATLQVQSQTVSRFKRVNGQWKLDFPALPQNPVSMARFCVSTAQAAEKTANRIAQGDFKTPDKAFAEFQKLNFNSLNGG